MTASCSAAFARLRQRASRPDARRITSLFAADPGRAARFTVALDDLTLDFSKSSIDDEALDALFDLAETAGLNDFRRRMFGGEMVNPTEHRAAMHMALRAPADAGLRAQLSGATDDASALAAAERARMQAFVEAVHMGDKKGATGARFALLPPDNAA